MLVRVNGSMVVNTDHIAWIDANGGHCIAYMTVREGDGVFSPGGQGTTSDKPVTKYLYIALDEFMELVNKEAALVHALEDAAKPAAKA